MKFATFETRKQIMLVLYSMAINFCLFTIFAAFSDEIVKNLIHYHYANWYYTLTIILLSSSGCSRIFGSIIYSYIGETETQYKIFYYSALILSISSFISGCIPHFTYFSVVSIIILFLIRISNGMLIGAVIPKAIIFNYTKSEPHRRVLTTCLIHVAEGTGFIIAILCSIIFDNLFHGYGWRIGMLFCGISGIIISYQLKAVFYDNNQAMNKAGFSALQLVFAKYKFVMFRLICFATFLSSGLSVFFYVMPNFLLSRSGYQAQNYRVACLFLIVGFVCGMFLAIKLDERLGKKFYIISGIMFKFWLVYVFSSFNKSNLIHITLLCSICTFVFGVYFAKLPVMIVSSFPKSVRYIGVAIVCNISFGLMFALSPEIIAVLTQLTHSLVTPTAYVIFFSYVSIISLWFMPKKIFNIHTHASYYTS